MIAKPLANVRAWSPPDSPRNLRITVTCPARTTVLHRVAGPDKIPAWVAAFVTLAAFGHAESCSACDVRDVHRKGAQWVHVATMWAIADRAPRSRRN